MALKHILVSLNHDKTCAARLGVAIELATRHDAHLTGLFVVPKLKIPSHAGAQLPNELFETHKRSWLENAADVERRFKEAVGKAQCQAEWVRAGGDSYEAILSHARSADLVVMSQAEDQGMLSVAGALDDQVVLGAGRPVLFVPYIGTSRPLGKRVMVAWDGSREVARAVNDAMPVLQLAETVEVVTVNPAAADGDIPTADICLHLARHDVKASGKQLIAKEISTGDALLSRTADEGMDLIVMGAYGHSRIMETVMGGVTRHILECMTVPVLMSH